ncbi:MAG: hypothetical protein ACUVUE_05700 [Candidatus Bathycorpusculaceae bacterium]
MNARNQTSPTFQLLVTPETVDITDLSNKKRSTKIKISSHTFRHWKATTLYHQTKNLLLVKQFLGHAEVDNTLLYIQIEQALYGQNSDDEFTVYGTNDKEEIKKLLSVGFDYVCQKDDILYFRKRK